MPKLPPSNFDPKMVSMLRSVLDAAVDQIDVANERPRPKQKWPNEFYGPRPMASRTTRF